MKSLYVAWQNEATREWIPVAELTKVEAGYQLRYTRGAQRAPGFVGLGRMSDMGSVYVSSELFPFFQNRLVSRGRPEYLDYVRWLGLEDLSVSDPMQLLGITGGRRATDSLEIIPTPTNTDAGACVDFFVRGLSHVRPSDAFECLERGMKLPLMLDVQNDFDACAVGLRTEDPKAFLGYVPKYFTKGLCKKLQQEPKSAAVTVRRINTDAPLDMRVLCRLDVAGINGETLIGAEDDFRPWESRHAESVSVRAIDRAFKALGS